ncbi:MAG: efflux RND transporter periplasmic adaptor subunit [Mailhella sp.]|nr:efflux RND transporter periplasmic adaptor subunit [Mailhella sp.]
MKGKIFVSIMLIAAAGAGWWWWQNRQETAHKVHYLTETVQRMTIRKTVNATGEVDAVQLVTVGAQASGKIIELRAEIGQQVRKGDLIAQIDPTTQSNALNAARAQLETFNAQLESRKVALKIAQTRYEREQRLRKSDATSRANLEDAENTLAAARASVKEMESQILQQKISVNTAETNLGYTRIVAPLDGTVVAVPVKQGQTVNANQTTPTIAQIADLADMEIKIEVSEGDIPFIKPGLRVRYTLLGAPDKPYHTSITSIDPGDKTLSDSTSTSSSSLSSSASSSNSAVYYYAKARVPNPDGVLRLGMTTQNVIEIDKAENVLAIPTITIQSGRRGKKFVQVLEGGSPVEREVETGITNNVMTEIRSGLNEGDKVIANQMTQNELKESINSRGPRGPRMR